MRMPVVDPINSWLPIYPPIKNSKLYIWRGVPSTYCLKGSPALEFGHQAIPVNRLARKKCVAGNVKASVIDPVFASPASVFSNLFQFVAQLQHLAVYCHALLAFKVDSRYSSPTGKPSCQIVSSRCRKDTFRYKDGWLLESSQSKSTTCINFKFFRNTRNGLNVLPEFYHFN